MAGGTKSKPFFAGAILLQPAEALDAFVRAAQPGNEIVYCEAPEPQRTADGWLRAGELARDGLIRTHQRRRQGGGWQWYAVRTAKGMPKQVSPQEKVLGDEKTQIIFTELKRAANLGLPCPSDAALAAKAGLSMRQQAQWRVRELIRVELLSSTLVYEGGVPSRVVTIAETRWAGAAAGKFTALPKKWAALQEAATRDFKQAAGGSR